MDHHVPRDSVQVTGTSLVPELVATGVLSILFVTILTGSRLAVKIRLSQVQIEDFLAWALLIGFNSLVLSQIRYGFAQHVVSISPDADHTQAKYFWVNSLLWNLVMASAKTTLSLQFYRLFCPGPHGIVFIVNTILMCFNLLWLAVCFFVLLFQCVPPRKVWEPQVSGQCKINPAHEYDASGSFNALADVLLLFLPAWAIWRLKMQIKRKLQIMALFSVGILACLCSILRLVYSIALDSSQNMRYDSAKAVMWSIAEISAIIIVTCFPLMPRFWEMFIRDREPCDPKDGGPVSINSSELSEDIGKTRPTRRDDPECSVPHLRTMKLTDPEISFPNDRRSDMAVRRGCA